jgi:serine/threonine protein kinase
VSAPQDLIAGRYRLVNRVGSGGMGVVWEAWDERLHRRVAAKLVQLPLGLSSDEAAIANKRAMREARISARLHHRHAVPVFDVVDDDGQPCLIMQFLPSITLAEVLREVGSLQPHEAAQVGAQIGSALAAAHELGIVHRDVKPSNILIADDGSALISDFGISHALGDVTITTNGLVHGTPAYLAPEAARGEEANFASDVFSLGSTLYAAMEGSPPFGTDQNSIALLHRVAAGTYMPPRQSGLLTPLLLQMLSAEPSTRPSMQAVASILAGLASSGAARQTPGPEQPTQPLAGLASNEAARPTLARAVPTQPIAGSTTTAAPGLPSEAGAAATTTAHSQAPTAAETPPVESTPRRPVATRVGSSPSSTGEGSSARPSERRRWAARWGVAVVVLVAVGTLIAVLISTLGGPGTGSIGQPPATSTAAAPRTTLASPSPTSSASSDPTVQASPSAGKTSGSPRPSARETRTRPPGSSSPTAAQLAEAITSYYALLPGNTDRAWPRMTTTYQTNHAGGRQAYEQFWSAIRRVTVRKVSASPPSRARATLVYYFKDGRVITELTSYELVRERGTLKISGSTVLSSSTR